MKDRRRWLYPWPLLLLVALSPGCEGPLGSEQVEFEPTESSAFFNWFGGQIYLGLEDDRAQRMWVLMEMDCEDDESAYAVRRRREPVEGEAAVRFMRQDGHLPQLFAGVEGSVELTTLESGELAVTVFVVVVDGESGERITISGTYEIIGIAMT